MADDKIISFETMCEWFHDSRNDRPRIIEVAQYFEKNQIHYNDVERFVLAFAINGILGHLDGIMNNIEQHWEDET